MAKATKNVTNIDGSLDFSGGVDSNAVTTVASERFPNGIKRNQVPWMINGTTRGGGIVQRPGWRRLGRLPPAAVGLYQGHFIYEPNSGTPYVIACIGGNIWKFDPDDPEGAVNISGPAVLNQTQIVNGQVGVILNQTAAGGLVAGDIVNETAGSGGADPIGVWRTFICPGVGNNVRVPLAQVYNGALGAGIAAGEIPLGGTATWDVVGTFGWYAGGPSTSALTMPADRPRVYFCQAEEFLVIQAGDGVTLPLFWDGLTLRRSLGLSGSYGAPESVNHYGALAAITSAPFVVPAVGAVVVVNLTQNYVGNVGDQLSLLTLAGWASETVGADLLSFTNERWRAVVTAIGVNTVSLETLGATVGIVGSTITDPSYLARLNFVNATPSTGASSAVGTPELPTATAMDYYMGRIWYAQGRQYSAGDIVGSQASGTATYNLRDSVLKVTENPLAIGGDGFAVPAASGNIRAIKHAANLNTQLGQGQLYIFTRRAIYSLSVPISRQEWINTGNTAAGSTNMPLQSVAQITNGSVNDRSIVQQNGDLFYQSFEPGIRSLIVAVRDFNMWANTPISTNINRILAGNNRALMAYASGIAFSNRVLQTVLPFETPVGIAFSQVVPLNFDVASTLQQRLPPVWEGSWNGLDFLELSQGEFSGRQRAFGVIYSRDDSTIQFWEIEDVARFEGGDNRVLWQIEFPAYTWGDEFELKRLLGAELWIDRLFGEVMFCMEYRPDCSQCWYPWKEWKECTARNSIEAGEDLVYPTEKCESYRQMMVMPKPPAVCAPATSRPSDIGYQFQARLTIKGFCRVRGLFLKAVPVENHMYGPEMVC